MADISKMIRRKRFEDKAIVRMSYRFEDNQYVFILKSLSGSEETTGKDVTALQLLYWPRYGENRVNFRFETLVHNYEFVEASKGCISAGSTIYNGNGLGTTGLVVKWVTQRLSDAALKKWGLSRNGGDQYALVTAEHVARHTDPNIHIKKYWSLGNEHVATSAEVRALPAGKLLSTYYSLDYEYKYLDLIMCTIQPDIVVDPTIVNKIADKFIAAPGIKPIDVDGEIVKIEDEHIAERDPLRPFFLLGHYNRSFGRYIEMEPMLGVDYIVCELFAQPGDSGGLLFERDSFDPHRIIAVGILSKVVTNRDKFGRVVSTQAWCTPLRYLNLDVIELVRPCTSIKSPPSDTTRETSSDCSSCEKMTY